MTAEAWTLAVGFAVTVFLLFIALGEIERLRAGANHLGRQRNLADAERTAVQADLDRVRAERDEMDRLLAVILADRPMPSAKVIRLPRQRNGEGA